MKAAIHKATITKVNPETNEGLATIDDKLKIVKYGAKFQDQEILVRVDTDKSSNTAYFLTQDVPEKFSMLTPNQYVLAGIIGTDQHEKMYPTVEEVLQHYDPGNIKKVLYFKQDSSRRKGRKILRRRTPKIRSIYENLNRILKVRLPDGHQHSRVIVTDGQQGIEMIAEEATKLGLATIQMQPIYQ